VRKIKDAINDYTPLTADIWFSLYAVGSIEKNNDYAGAKKLQVLDMFRQRKLLLQMGGCCISQLK
jgi:hypothetical protein